MTERHDRIEDAFRVIQEEIDRNKDADQTSFVRERSHLCDRLEEIVGAVRAVDSSKVRKIVAMDLLVSAKTARPHLPDMRGILDDTIELLEKAVSEPNLPTARESLRDVLNRRYEQGENQ